MLRQREAEYEYKLVEEVRMVEEWLCLWGDDEEPETYENLP